MQTVVMRSSAWYNPKRAPSAAKKESGMANDSDYRDTFLSINKCLRVVKCGVNKGYVKCGISADQNVFYSCCPYKSRASGGGKER